MDKITKNLLEDFVAAQDYTQLPEDQAFERFCNYVIVSKEYSDTFDIDDVSSGGPNDLGIDGVAILVNGRLVTSADEVEDLAALNGYVEASFIFVQGKMQSGFDSKEILKYSFGAKDFFSDNPKLERNEFIQQAVGMEAAIFAKSAQMSKGNPTLRLYYATTGKWVGDKHLTEVMESERQSLANLGLFGKVEFIPLGADQLQRLYHETKHRAKATFTFTYKTLLPDIDGVSEAYVGVLPAKEYLSIITDEIGNIRKPLFYDNVRDFQKYNPVNKDIRSTLQSEQQAQFPLLNNGVTLIAKSLHTVGNKFHIEDFQVVNGCQTSHVVYDERSTVRDSMFIPLKIIVTQDDSIRDAIIKATNRQTEVKTEQLFALSDFQKKLEAYFNTFGDKQKLYYERRSKQYDDVPGIEKVRIVSMPVLIRAFASMFLDEPHRASRYYSTLLELVGKKIFAEDHLPEPYYASAFCHYKLEFLFRNGLLDVSFKPARYHLLMGFRHIICGSASPSPTSNKIKGYCYQILDTLWDESKAGNVFATAASVIEAANGGIPDRDTVKTQAFTDQFLGKLAAAV